MSLLTFIKENRVLVAGIILPLLLVGLLTYAKTIPEKTVPDPQHKVAYSTQSWSGIGTISFKIDKNGYLTATFKKNKRDYQQNNTNPPTARILIYDFKTNSNTEFILEISDEDSEKESVTLSLPELKNVIFSSKTTSPDNYLFEPYHYKNHTLITDIFISSSRNYGPTISKDGRLIKLPQTTTYYGNFEFLGWVIEDKEQGQ